MATESNTSGPVKGAELLPADYQPCENTVILGRGKKIASWEGNVRLAEIVNSQLQSYSVESNKLQKSFIILRIMKQVKSESSGNHGFVKEDSSSGRWYAVCATMARGTIAQAFRNADHEQYRSSKQQKKWRRLTTRDSSSSKDKDSDSGDSSSITGDCGLPSRITSDCDLPPVASNSLQSMFATPRYQTGMSAVTTSSMFAFEGEQENCSGPFRSSKRNVMIPPWYPQEGSAPPMVGNSGSSLRDILDQAMACVDQSAVAPVGYLTDAMMMEDPFEPIPLSEAMGM